MAKRLVTLALTMVVTAVVAFNVNAQSNEAQISESKEWKFDNITLETGTNAQEIDGLYFKGLNSTNTGYGVTSGSKSGTYTNGIAWSATCYAKVPNGSDLSSGTTMNSQRTPLGVTASSFYRSFAFNAATSGTCYVIFGSGSDSETNKFNIYFNYKNGTSWTCQTVSESATKNPKEIKLSCTTTGTFWINGTGGTYYVYAIRFEPEVVSKPTFDSDGNATGGESNLYGDDNINIKTYYKFSTSETASYSVDDTDWSEDPISISEDGYIYAYSENTVTGKKSEIAVSNKISKESEVITYPISFAGLTSSDVRFNDASLFTEGTNGNYPTYTYNETSGSMTAKGITFSYARSGNPVFMLHSNYLQGDKTQASITIQDVPEGKIVAITVAGTSGSTATTYSCSIGGTLIGTDNSVLATQKNSGSKNY